ncbi:transposable element Tcb1 transposase [Trichonephila clavipes]|uniref:Transposable element Tcb1 transposase n=1 Tax=Trichonephila clavipes TaxID=2585209 RepID=A0A8X6UVZ3_TRICX|nr:transposable element Tcb1 transposase [Trichonephila clavipes]
MKDNSVSRNEAKEHVLECITVKERKRAVTCVVKLISGFFSFTRKKPAAHQSYSWCDGMKCHCLQYTVTPSIDPWHHDSPMVCSCHPATTCVGTHATAPRSHFSTRECSASHSKAVTRLSSHCYYSFLAYPIPRFVSNRAYLGSFGTASWASHEFERTRGNVIANMERDVS